MRVGIVVTVLLTKSRYRVDGFHPVWPRPRTSCSCSVSVLDVSGWSIVSGTGVGGGGLSVIS